MTFSSSTFAGLLAITDGAPALGHRVEAARLLGQELVDRLASQGVIGGDTMNHFGYRAAAQQPIPIPLPSPVPAIAVAFEGPHAAQRFLRYRHKPHGVIFLGGAIIESARTTPATYAAALAELEMQASALIADVIATGGFDFNASRDAFGAQMYPPL